MGQRWVYLCIDNRQRSGQLRSLSEAFYADPLILEYSLLRRQAVDLPVPATPPDAPLERLPPLIKRRICAFLVAVDMDSLMCACLATPHLAVYGWVALNNHMPWAGKRIVTLGSGAEDLPQNLLTAAEEKCLLDPSRRTGYVVNGWAFSDPWESALSETYPRAHGYITRCLWSGHGVWSQISVEARARGRPAPPENAVLCNLTLKQYYWSDSHCRGCKCRSCKDNQGSRDTTNFGLGQVVPIMTCWSHNPSTGFRTRWTQNDVRGKWAGHRLGIVARDSVPADWEDVTEAVRATLIRLTGETR